MPKQKKKPAKKLTDAQRERAWGLKHNRPLQERVDELNDQLNKRSGQRFRIMRQGRRDTVQLTTKTGGPVYYETVYSAKNEDIYKNLNSDLRDGYLKRIIKRHKK